MKEFFEELFLYNRTENETLIKLLHNTENVPVRILQHMSHILLVHQSWNRRMQDKDGLSDFWQTIPVQLLHSENSNQYIITGNIISSRNIDNTIEYKNSKGIKFANTYKDILFHIINHGTHHRSQINMLLKSTGMEPPILDYIFYKR